MRVTSRKQLSGFRLALLTALLSLAASGQIYAQTASRSFQMTLWVNLGSSIPTSADADVLTFFRGRDQPPGRSILILTDWSSGTRWPPWDTTGSG